MGISSLTHKKAKNIFDYEDITKKLSNATLTTTYKTMLSITGEGYISHCIFRRLNNCATYAQIYVDGILIATLYITKDSPPISIGGESLFVF